MSEIATDATAEHAEEHSHPSDWEYVKIAVVLAMITGVEVFTYFESVLDWGAFLIPSLMVMMVVKFWLVARMFMHLKADKPILSQLFTMGIAMAVAVYMITLLAFNFF
jgi:cytochrome c oxidase subunit 4